MNRIFVTGDTHGDFDIAKLNRRRFPVQSELTKEDYLIVTGDFGACWYGGKDIGKTNVGYEIPPHNLFYSLGKSSASPSLVNKKVP